MSDDDAHVARVVFARAAAAGIKTVGERLYVMGYVLRDDSARAVSLAARMGGALAGGACDLLEADNAYAAAALARQFVEIEYLLWTFGDDAEDAARWLHASRSQLESRFRPAAMRTRSDGHFRSEEYRSHCDIGGHPNPRGWVLLSAAPPFGVVRAGWADLGQHLERAWRLLAAACETASCADALGDELELIERARSDWHARDALAGRIPLPEMGPTRGP